MREVVIVSAARTPIGNFNGSLSPLSAVDIGVVALEEAIKRAGIDKNDIEEVLIGNVLSAGLGQNVSRQIAINSGLDVSIPAMTIDKVCGSGLRAVSLGAQLIKSGDRDIVACGGTESMSNSPYVVNKIRKGVRMGHQTMVDSMINDGLWDIFNDYHMGITAENLAEKYNITREEQDEFSVKSQNKAEKARREGKFKDEIIPVTIPQRRGDPVLFENDEYIREGATLEGLERLRPAFKKDGTVTAANASGINDGAAMLIIMSKEKAEELGLKPLAKIVSYGQGGVDPKIMGYGVVPAVREALEKGKISIEDIDLIEGNEAFAAQALTVARELNFDPDITNVNGGAIALGHPIGASGSRILTTLLYEMEKRKSKLGLATLCIGGGMGTALIVERMG